MAGADFRLNKELALGSSSEDGDKQTWQTTDRDATCSSHQRNVALAY